MKARALPLSALCVTLLSAATASARVHRLPVRPRAPVASVASADPAPVAASAALTLVAAAAMALLAARRRGASDVADA